MNTQHPSTRILRPTRPLFREPAAAGVRSRRSPVKLAPLIDVVFILLVFFMLASSFIDWRAIPLDAPGADAGDSTVVGAVLIDIRHDGLRLGGQPMAAEALMARVEAAVTTAPERRFLVRPGAGVPLQHSVEILDSLHAAGARNVSLISGLGAQQ